jgi:hypothetical protein
MSHGFIGMRSPEATPRFHIVVVEELFSDLLADRVFLLVQSALFLFGDVATAL